MSTKKLQFGVYLESVQGNEALMGSGSLFVEIHGTDPFLGLSVWHEDHGKQFRGQPRIVLSRTGTFNSRSGVIDTPRYELTTMNDPDPLIAASRALSHQLENQIPAVLGRGVAEGLRDNPFHQSTYRDRIVEPISTAVLAMCRDASLHQGLEDGDRLWAIGTWTLGKSLSDKKMSELIGLGEQVQDVLVVLDKGNTRGYINSVVL